MNETRATRLNQPSAEQLDLPFYNLLPKDPVACLKWKLYVRKRCVHDTEFREAIWEACRQDPAFFGVTFCWIFEPRPPRQLPLTWWMDQVDVLAWFKECLETDRDAAVEKTRGIGMSWTLAVFTLWVWLFHPEAKIGLMSKDETVIDGPDSNFLLGKIVYMIEHLPAWARFDHRGRPILKRNTTTHILENLFNKATIQGFPPVESKIRGLRFTFFAYDEFAFFPRDAQEALNTSVHTAPCRLFISTWKGRNNVFHKIIREEKSTLLRIQTYWWNNPERWVGCYTTEANRLKIIDHEYQYEADYPFVLDGLMRSPWVDFELSRAGGNDLQSAMEELYGLSAESGRKWFRETTIELARTMVEGPQRSGTLERVLNRYLFHPSPDGALHLWDDVGDGKGGPFVAASDLGYGVGAALSTLEVVSLATRCQVMEFATNKMDPVTFAQFVFDVLEWLNGSKGDGHTMFTFENNAAVGTTFCNELVRLGYGNIQRYQYKTKVQRNESMYYGVKNNDGGAALLAEMERAIRDGAFTPRSPDMVDEMERFERDEKNKPECVNGPNGHGDRTMGLAMAWDLARTRIEATAAQFKPESKWSELENLRDIKKSWRDSWKLPA